MPEHIPGPYPFSALFYERPPGLDYPASLPPEGRRKYLKWLGTFEALLTPAPERWGLRGDPFLWEELRASLGRQELPDSVSALLKTISARFRELTAHKLLNEGQLFIKRYSHGGMSSGYIDMGYWRGPLWRELVSRFRLLLDLRQVPMKVREKDLDLLLEHALWESSGVRGWLLQACGLSAANWNCVWSRADNVWTSVLDAKGTKLEGETDVLVGTQNAGNERLALHIENKRPGRRFVNEQAVQYPLRAAKLAASEKYGNYTSWRTILVAPRSLIEEHQDEVAYFDALVDYHELACRLRITQ